jgi:uncharacterized protein with PIN domain
MRFIADAMLGTLAKWLRIAGYDTLFDPDMDDHQLVRQARADDRVLLTRDRELARRRGVHILFVTDDQLDDQMTQVITEFGLEPDTAFSRCSICNELLLKMEPDTAQSHVPAYVAQAHQTFKYCPACQRVYWRGTHWQRMGDQLARMLSTDVPPAAEGMSRDNKKSGG